MRSRISQAVYRARLALFGAGSIANTVEVRWTEVSGGVVDPGTGARVGGVRTTRSGTLRALSLQEPPITTIRQYAEVQAGDLLLDTDPDGTVTLSDETTTTLDAIAAHEPMFLYAGRGYVQKKVGGHLAAAWDAMTNGQKLFRTLLLRPAT